MFQKICIDDHVIQSIQKCKNTGNFGNSAQASINHINMNIKTKNKRGSRLATMSKYNGLITIDIDEMFG